MRRNWLILALIAPSLPVALYALVQHAGNDPLAWQQGFGTRVFSSQGNPLFLSAPSALNQITQSRMICTPPPPILAASVRVAPSSIAARARSLRA